MALLCKDFDDAGIHVSKLPACLQSYDPNYCPTVQAVLLSNWREAICERFVTTDTLDHHLECSNIIHLPLSRCIWFGFNRLAWSLQCNRSMYHATKDWLAHSLTFNSRWPMPFKSQINEHDGRCQKSKNEDKETHRFFLSFSLGNKESEYEESACSGCLTNWVLTERLRHMGYEGRLTFGSVRKGREGRLPDDLILLCWWSNKRWDWVCVREAAGSRQAGNGRGLDSREETAARERERERRKSNCTNAEARVLWFFYSQRKGGREKRKKFPIGCQGVKSSGNNEGKKCFPPLDFKWEVRGDRYIGRGKS